MREAFGDIWEMAAELDAPLVCVTTNLQVNSSGEAVMGAGIAREARDLYPGVARELGRRIKKGEHSTIYLGVFCDDFGLTRHLAAFPTKRHWRDRSDLGLIEESAQVLVEVTDLMGFQDVLLPRPGCGRGGLTWAQVQPLIASLLDERFAVVGYAGEAPDA